MERVRKMIRAAAQDVFPYTGKGVTAAILDSGIAMHPDIRKNVAAFYDFVDGQKTPYDDSGHGTHVAGCLCGNGFCSGKKYAGLAPDCRIVACKVLDEKGEGCAEDMIRAIRWCIQTKELYGTRILSLSVGLSNLKDSRVNENLQ